MKKIFLTATAIALSIAIMTSCASKETKVQEKAKVVKTALVEAKTIDQIAEFVGTIEPFAKNNIGSNMPIRIEQIFVEVGSYVKKGQLLVKMDASQYTQTAVQLANLEVDYQRTKTVYEAGGIPRQQLDQLEAQVDVTREAAKTLKDNIELRSPINGVVTGRYFDAGDLYSMSVNASGNAGILTVMQMGTLKVVINVSEQYFTKVRNGMPVDIAVDLFPDQLFKGKVSLIYPAINTSSRTFAVEVSIPNSNMKLRPGMFSRTTLKLGKKEAILVNDIAVQKQVGTNERYVFVLKEGKVERRSINLGLHIGDKYDILSGISAGEEVVIAGAAKLSDGDSVEVKN